MGSPEGEKDRESDEQQHRVRLTRPFYLGVYEVTVGQFGKFVEATKYVTAAESAPTDREAAVGWDESSGQLRRNLLFKWQTPGYQQSDEHPVVDVNQDDVEAFCKWLGDAEHKHYRLPTEAEWEYACRAGTKTAYFFGDKISQADAHISKSLGEARSPTKVGSYKPNAFGLCDMHGNVGEWCSDLYGDKYYATSPADDPPGSKSGYVDLGGRPEGPFSVYRGGNWALETADCRSARRGRVSPSAKASTVGFRVALTPGRGPSQTPGAQHFWPVEIGLRKLARGVWLPFLPRGVAHIAANAAERAASSSEAEGDSPLSPRRSPGFVPGLLPKNPVSPGLLIGPLFGRRHLVEVGLAAGSRFDRRRRRRGSWLRVGAAATSFRRGRRNSRSPIWPPSAPRPPSGPIGLARLRAFAAAPGRFCAGPAFPWATGRFRGSSRLPAADNGRHAEGHVANAVAAALHAGHRQKRLAVKATASIDFLNRQADGKPGPAFLLDDFGPGALGAA